jgi:RHS repeat-associated protein
VRHRASRRFLKDGTRSSLPQYLQISSSVGQVSSAQDNSGRTVSYVYNASGYLTEFHDANGGVTKYGYDSGSRMATYTTPNGNVNANNTYDANNRVTHESEPDGGQWGFSYLLNSGNVTEADVTDPRGYLHDLTFDSNAYSLSDTWAVGKPEQQTYSFSRDPNTELINSVTDGLNRVTAFTYDSLANITSVTRLYGTSNAATTSYTYDPTYSQVTSVTDPLNHVWTLGHDALGNLASVTDPLTHQTTATYTGAGQIKTLTDPLSHTTSFGYAAGLLSTVTDPLGATSYIESDSAGRTLETFDALGNSTAFSYDPLDRLTGTIDARGGTTGFGYDADSNLLSVTDANSNKTSYIYESMDRRATRKDALLATESYTYDYNGNLTQVTDRRGVVTKYQYDGLNRRTFAGFGWNGSSYQSTINYSYDGADRLTQAVDSLAGTLTQQYDGLDNLTQEMTPLGTVNTSYDLARRRATLQVVGQSQVSYGFDNANRLTSETQGSQSVGLSYDSADRRTCLTLPNGVITSYGYDNDSRVTSITYGTGGSCTSPPNNLGNLTYTYDADGRRLSVGGGLAAVTLPANVAGGSSTTYNSDNEQTNFNSTSFSFDANGNLTNDGTYTYTYDGRNQLNQINQFRHGGKLVATLGYDGLGRRQTKVVNGTTTQFLYDGLNPVQELNGATPPAVTANLLTGLDIDEYFTRKDASGNLSTFLSDALWSTVGLVGSAGTIATSYTYEPFGATTVSGASNGNVYEFTGRENDDTAGLYYYRARYYNPGDQRFMAQDPTGFRGDSPNLYGYVIDDPTNAVDPTGLKIRPCKKGDCPPAPPNTPDWQADATAWPPTKVPRRHTHRGQTCFESVLTVGSSYLHCCYDKTGHPIYGDNGSAWEDWNPNVWWQWPFHAWEWEWYW